MHVFFKSVYRAEIRLHPNAEKQVFSPKFTYKNS